MEFARCCASNVILNQIVFNPMGTHSNLSASMGSSFDALCAG